MSEQNTTQQLEASKKKFLDKVDQLTAEYRQNVRSITKSLEDRRLSRLKDELNNS